MASRPASAPLSRAPVPIESGAVAHLRYIRDTIESAHAFTSVPGKGCIAMGVVGLGAAALSSWPSLAERWLEVWLGAAGMAGAVVSWFLVEKARVQGLSLLRSVARRFFLALAPALVAGAVLTLVMARSGARDLIPGTWLLLYGAGLTAAGVFSLREVIVAGAAFMLLGAVAFALPAQWSALPLALGFGLVHVALGCVVLRRHGG
jgi:hypothetical protein